MREWEILFPPVSVLGFFLRPCLPTRPGGIMCVCLMSRCLELLSPGSFAPLPAATLASWWCRALPPGGRGGPAFVCQLPPPCLLSSKLRLAGRGSCQQGRQEPAGASWLRGRQGELRLIWPPRSPSVCQLCCRPLRSSPAAHCCRSYKLIPLTPELGSENWQILTGGAGQIKDGERKNLVMVRWVREEAF